MRTLKPVSYLALAAICGAALLTSCASGGHRLAGITAGTASHWTWESGSNTTGAAGVYGTEGNPSSANTPGARYGAASWEDSGGNLWLFGGNGYDATGTLGDLNDLWEFSPASNSWGWMSGSSTVPQQNEGQLGVYGTLGLASAGNMPGGRHDAVSWIDSSGDLWLFGGAGVYSGSPSEFLNDLWKFSPSTKQWTWVSGSDTQGEYGVYGIKGAAAAGNVPGARSGAVSWMDSSGNLWLFGGEGPGTDPTQFATGLFNDLWKFNPNTNQWTWESGSDAEYAPGVYGTQGLAASSNVPGARKNAVGWTDANGNFWLFGGESYDSTGGNIQWMNDLWEFDTSTRVWTWMSGASTGDAFGVYGTQGTPSVNNAPGARSSATAWIDSTGNLWLFGGNGYDVTGTLGALNDLWEFDTATNEWTWMGGVQTTAATGIYGTKGTGSSDNAPGARIGAAGWTDGSGDFWLFGGQGYDATGTDGYLNDLWRYQP